MLTHIDINLSHYNGAEWHLVVPAKTATSVFKYYKEITHDNRHLFPELFLPRTDKQLADVLWQKVVLN